jgi:hypothetical protein
MKTHFEILLGGLLAGLLTGCAGYNTTMFMTKSNVGLDFDAKPPTAEINISRKEAVIAPSFEGGQTPPVMASFKPSVGTGGGFTSFFMGVDQTFAGGDAALAMSKLYDKPTVSEKGDYDSKIILSEAPIYKNWFQKVPGPGSTRPLIFGTDTSLGLKVAWSGAGGQIPDTVKLGFNRKEFAWAPLSVTPTTFPAKVDEKGKIISAAVAVKMPAFLATIESKQAVGGDGTNKISVEALQYFATGDSATYLAMQKDVRAAMHARLDPNTLTFKGKFGKSAQPILRHLLSTVYDSLNSLKEKDELAAEHVRRLNNLEDLDVPDSFMDAQMVKYAVLDPTGASPAILESDDQFNKAFSKTAVSVTAYLAILENNVRDMKRAVAFLDAKTPLKITKNNGTPADLSEADRARLKKQLVKQEKRLTELREAISGNRVILAAFGYLETLISPK